MSLKTLRSFVYVIAGFTILVALVAFSYAQLLDLGALLSKLFGDDAVMFVVGAYLLFFLCLLILRYLALIVFSFLEHMEYVLVTDPTFTQNYQRDDTLPLISLIVPAYNEGKVIQPALRNLLTLEYPDYEVIVVDDGSSDNTYELASAVARESMRVHVRVVTKPNGGKADALNTGIAVARGEFVMCMDGDTKLSRNALRAMIRHFDDPRVGGVAGNVRVFNRENLLTKIQALEYIEGLAMVRKAQSFVRTVNIIPGPCAMFRKSVVRSFGGYDLDTFAEDCDITLKLIVAGWHIAYEPLAVGWVETPSRLLDLLKQRYRWTRGILQAMRKHRYVLRHPLRAGFLTSMTLWYMLFEGILWPISNILGNVFFAYVGLKYGVVSFVLFWWLQLTLLDVIAAAYCTIVEKEDPRIIFYAVMFRLYYMTIIDVAKVIATIEEVRGTRMTWGKLEREGKLT
ncbi:MAG: glycosyltransferase family 2 protein [Bacillota bacterium]